MAVEKLVRAPRPNPRQVVLAEPDSDPVRHRCPAVRAPGCIIRFLAEPISDRIVLGDMRTELVLRTATADERRDYIFLVSNYAD
ncbi:hypothetical protein ACIQM0_27730 [Streptomyces sp. NPDC091387]|uniref:hypothetical protein n=1 Tax=Streptomyces sp. NPDC091387 TaxID=3365998 RepID=UPI003807078A